MNTGTTAAKQQPQHSQIKKLKLLRRSIFMTIGAAMVSVGLEIFSGAQQNHRRRDRRHFHHFLSVKRTASRYFFCYFSTFRFLL